MAEYRLTPAAVRDLEGIWVYSRAQWGTAQADRYIDLVTDNFKTLATSASPGRQCEDIRPGYRRQNVAQHVIYLRCTDYGVEVIRVLHGRMDMMRHL